MSSFFNLLIIKTNNAVGFIEGLTYYTVRNKLLKKGDYRKETLGKTKEKLSIIDFGGIVVKNEIAKNASSYVSTAIERGINYFNDPDF